ncbi:uncharacterized protein LOC102450090 [Pelodiscus sinensis]|uniref:uncharacterized protein LOC102450090 n=1 Tax=Pelodiscus sinensis TaxID=13735 RepID=UPI003F6ADB94
MEFPMPAPVCLIENSPGGELRVQQEALRVLEEIAQPVVVVSIAGLYRTGKSYLMNKLAGRTTGFSLGSTVQSHTKGIWMWVLPHPRRAGHALVLLDTEGLGDVEKGDTKNDTWIFSLAVLLSSTLVYNSKGTIDQYALDQLHYVSELSERIKVKAAGEGGRQEREDSAEFVRFFPAFVWAVRDFTLQLELDGRPITEDEYLENGLKLKPGSSQRAQLHNLPRECIRQFFPARKCFVFVQPASRKDLPRLEELREDQLEPEFREQGDRFCRHVWETSQPKTLPGGHVVTGAMLGTLAVTYVDAIRSGAVPCLESAVLALAQMENSAAVGEAVAAYEGLLERRAALPTESVAELLELHAQCEREALRVFMARAFKDDDRLFQGELMRHMEEQKQRLFERNEQASSDRCTAVLLELWDELDDRIGQSVYAVPGGYQRFLDDRQEMVERYRQLPGKGVKADAVLQEFLQAKEAMAQSILQADAALTEKQKEMAAQQARAEAAEREQQVLQQREAELQQKLEDQERSFQENMQQLEQRLGDEREKLLEEQGKMVDQKLKEQEALLKEGFRKESERMEREIQRLQQQSQEIQKPSWLQSALGTLCDVASFVLPGFAGKAIGAATNFFRRLHLTDLTCQPPDPGVSLPTAAPSRGAGGPRFQPTPRLDGRNVFVSLSATRNTNGNVGNGSAAWGWQKGPPPCPPQLPSALLPPGAMEKPICLIENSPGGELRVQQEALRVLEEIAQPVVVVAIAGLYRTGKSYLMNKLAGKDQGGFSLGSTVQSHTKGIWMWVLPHPRRAGHALVLLDTEGLGDVEKGNVQNDAWIFALAVLLSSTLVYNSLGTIDQYALEQLHYVSELSERIKVKAAGEGDRQEGEDSAEFVRFFPAFVWAVRDFALQLELDGREITEDEYLENSLKRREGQPRKLDLPKKCLRQSFPSRKCFVFDRPAPRRDLPRLEQLPESALSPEFLEQARRFCSYIHQHAGTKTLPGGHVVTGTLLGTLAVTYVDAIRSGAVPCLESAVLALAQMENSAAVGEAVAAYEGLLERRAALPTESVAELLELHAQCEREALRVFMARAFKDDEQQYQRQLKDTLDSRRVELCRRNKEASSERCMAALRDLSQELEERVREGTYSVPGGYQRLLADQREMAERYQLVPGKGLMAAEMLQQFLKSKETVAQAVLQTDQSLTDRQKEIEAERARAEAAEREAQLRQELQARTEQLLQDQERSHQEHVQQLTAKMEQERGQLLAEQERALALKLQEQAQLLREGFQGEAAQLRQQIQNLSWAMSQPRSPDCVVL